MKSVELKQIDKERWVHWQAFLNFAVKAEKGRGKRARPRYRNFEDFFNYKKEIKRVLNEGKSEKDEPTTITRLRDYYVNKKTGGITNG